MPLTNDEINNLLNIEESFHASYKMDEIIRDKVKRETVFNKFLELESDLTYDWFTDYFQSEHSDRKAKKQDFTPDGAVQIASGVIGDFSANADLCAGTGGLTIKRYSKNKNALFYCEELSDRALPFLLFNLSIRNLNAVVCHGDSLERNFKAIYKLEQGERFSDITEIEKLDEFKYNSVIMNPPYSLKWNADNEKLKDKRCKKFEALAPKSKADFAFLQTGLSLLDDNGTMSIILPHGVLFRGSSEEKIRKKIIELNLLDAVIGLPGKIFFNTDIPTVILVLKKNRKENSVLFIDASKEFTKGKNHNILEQKHVDKILETYKNRTRIDKFSENVTYEQIKENKFNLNIPRYVDTYEPEPVKPLEDISEELYRVSRDIEESKEELYRMISQLVGTNEKADREIKAFSKSLGNILGIKDVTDSLKEGQVELFD